MSCKCITTDGVNVVAGGHMIKWCSFFKDMLEGVGDTNNTNNTSDETEVQLLCTSKMFTFTDEFCKFYDPLAYDYAVVDQYDANGKLTRSADFDKGRPIVRFPPLLTMIQNATSTDTKNYARRKSAWEWLLTALEASEYFSCDPLTVEISRSMAYIITGMDSQALLKITGVEANIWPKLAEEVIMERNKASTTDDSIKHVEYFDAIYKSINADIAANTIVETANDT